MVRAVTEAQHLDREATLVARDLYWIQRLGTTCWTDFDKASGVEACLSTLTTLCTLDRWLWMVFPQALALGYPSLDSLRISCDGLER